MALSPLTRGTLAYVYFGAAELDLSFASAQPNASPVWPASGLAMAAAVILGSWAWPGIAVGAFTIYLLAAPAELGAVMVVVAVSVTRGLSVARMEGQEYGVVQGCASG